GNCNLLVQSESESCDPSYFCTQENNRRRQYDEIYNG
ncbi:MAG: hypothetical protein ACI8RD_008660, partial [Bacillariaceae sp.]